MKWEINGKSKYKRMTGKSARIIANRAELFAIFKRSTWRKLIKKLAKKSTRLVYHRTVRKNKSISLMFMPSASLSE